MDVEDDFGGHIRQAIICDDVMWMVVPLAAVGDELECCELEVFDPSDEERARSWVE